MPTDRPRIHSRLRQNLLCLAMVIVSLLTLGCSSSTSTAHGPNLCQQASIPSGQSGRGAFGSGIGIDNAPPIRLTPYTLRQAYGLEPLCEAGITGKGQTVVVLAVGGLTSTFDQDLQDFDNQYQLPTLRYDVLWLADQKKDAGDASELELDIETIHAIAPEAHLTIAMAPSNDQFLNNELALLTLVEQTFQHNPNARILSTSLGVSEEVDRAFDHDANDVLQRMARDEQWSILAASGDTGAYSFGGSDQYIGPTFPASSPWVTAVGGTELQFKSDTDATVTGEVAWNESQRLLQGDISSPTRSGGGVSSVFAEPLYQAYAFPSGSVVANHLNGVRGVPDVAADASLASSLGYRIGGQWLVYAGTSKAAPLWAGIVALTNQKAKRPLGFLNNALYQLGAQSQDAYFQDITENTNQRFGHTDDAGDDAVKGYDFVTGWGSPLHRGTKLISALVASQTAPATPTVVVAPVCSAGQADQTISCADLTLSGETQGQLIVAGVSCQIGQNAFPGQPDAPPITVYAVAVTGSYDNGSFTFEIYFGPYTGPGTYTGVAANSATAQVHTGLTLGLVNDWSYDYADAGSAGFQATVATGGHAGTFSSALVQYDATGQQVMHRGHISGDWYCAMVPQQ
jgi:hypothetical protein